MKKTIFVVFSLMLLLLTACGEEQETTQDETQDETQDVQDINDLLNDDSEPEQELPEIMATVNGNEITSEQIKLSQNQFEMQGMQLSTEEVLNQLIIREVLMREAKERYQVTTEDIKEMLEEQGLTKETAEAQGMDFEEVIQQQLETGGTELVMLINEEKAKVEVSEEEIQQVYDDYSANGLEGSLEELRPEIESLIINNKVDQVLLSLAEDLMEESDIETFY